MKSSAYLVLPLLGPSTVRDGIGTGVAQLADPYRVCLRECGLPHGVPLAVNVVEFLDVRSQLIDSGADAFLASSADSYATARSAFLQRRAAEIADRDDDDARPAADATTPGDDAALDAAVKELQEQDAPPSADQPPPRQDVPTPATPKS